MVKSAVSLCLLLEACEMIFVSRERVRAQEVVHSDQVLPLKLTSSYLLRNAYASYEIIEAWI